MEKKIKVGIQRGGHDKPPIKDVWSRLAMQFQWKEAKPAAFYIEKAGSDSIQSRTKIPKEKFKLEKDHFYKGSIWHEGNLTQEQMTEQGDSLKVTTRLNLVIDGTESSRFVTGTLLPVELKATSHGFPPTGLQGKSVPSHRAGLERVMNFSGISFLA